MKKPTKSQKQKPLQNLINRQASDLSDAVIKGDRLALARAISKIENGNETPEGNHKLISPLYKASGKSRIIGITGPPGAGKSSLIDLLISEFRKKNRRVAVLAVDPSSPFTGGSILGDRVRMQRHYKDEGVFIRSLATRGNPGGLAAATREAIIALDAGGFDTILIETAGVGQTELGILNVAQTVVVVLVPESGDAIQVMKAGIMEIADIFAVNKSDRPAADQLVKEIVALLTLNPGADWKAPVIKTQAIKSKGIQALCDSIVEHGEFLKTSGRIIEKNKAFILSQIEDLLNYRVSERLKKLSTSKDFNSKLESATKREMSPNELELMIEKLIFNPR
jgi:LAO/AO transport system kinase